MPVASGSRWLAYVGGDGNVYAMSLEDERTVQLTDDATTPPEGQGHSYHRLSWSPHRRYLVHAERDHTLRDRVWLVDTKAEKGSDPILVGEGSSGVWSWGLPGNPPADDANGQNWLANWQKVPV